jgi:hypothetical protein
MEELVNEWPPGALPVVLVRESPVPASEQAQGLRHSHPGYAEDSPRSPWGSLDTLYYKLTSQLSRNELGQGREQTVIRIRSGVVASGAPGLKTLDGAV